MNAATKVVPQQGGIIVRAIPFAFDENINPAWHPNRREWSHMANGASLTMPYLEPFLIKTVRQALKMASNGQLKKDVHGFIAQEGNHFQNHRRYNEILKRHYPELAEVEDEMAADYKRFQSKSPRWRLAYTAGFETMTMGITEWLIGERRDLFKNADPSVASLILWHMVEETEHKNVAYDLYQDLYGQYWPRAWGLIYASWHVAWSSRKSYRRMLKRDGLWNSPASRLRLWAMVMRFLVKTSPAMLRSLVPGYHPGKVKDPDWVARWTKAYTDLPEGKIPLLDTGNADIPAQFAD
ncbi:MAG: metal-dependent hydrolase [Parasphingorhabdus sp.]